MKPNTDLVKTLIESSGWPWPVEAEEGFVTTGFATAFRAFDMIVNIEASDKLTCLVIIVTNIARVNGASGVKALRVLLEHNTRRKFTSFGVTSRGEVCCLTSVPRPVEAGQFEAQEVEELLCIAAHTVSDVYPELMAVLFPKEETRRGRDRPGQGDADGGNES